MLTRGKTCAAISLLLFASAVFGGAALAQPGFEEPPVLKASALAPPAMLRGPHFTVDDQVRVANLLPRFVVRSDFGVFEAPGRDMLATRVTEVGALAELEKTSKTGEFVKAAGSAAARPVTAAANMVMNPVETVKGAPAAVGRFFDRVQLGAKHVAGAAKSDGTTADNTVAVTKRVGGVTADVLGYEQERRALAKRLGVDPYTTNHVLSEKMNDVAWVSFSGRVGLNTVIAVVVPFSMAISATTITNDMVWDTKPADLIVLNEKKLRAMGVGEDRVAALIRNPWYSITALTSLVNSLEALNGVAGRDQVVTFAAAIATEDRARLAVAAVAMLARHHATVEPLVQLSAPGPIVARTKAGSILVPAPLDYVPWTEQVAQFAARPDLKAPARTVWLTGSASPRAKRELAAAGWTLREGTGSAR
jgi:hypothetical protein